MRPFKKLQLIVLCYILILSSANTLFAQKAYPMLTSNITWTGGYGTTLTAIQNAFNNGRTNENSQLGTSLPSITFPSSTEWNNKTVSEKIFWIMNKERVDRGLFEFEGLDTRLQDIAQTYAQYMYDHNLGGYSADGNNVWGRLSANPDIAACQTEEMGTYDAGINIGVALSSTNLSQTPPFEYVVYQWIYANSSESWARRNTVLDTTFVKNNGLSDKEGAVGIGAVEGGTYLGYNASRILVMHYFDQCPSWVFQTPVSTYSNSLVTYEDAKINIFPNPASQTLNINIPAINDNSNISITNIQGQGIYNVTPENGNKVIDVSSYAKGLYFLKIVSNNEIYREKVIIK